MAIPKIPKPNLPKIGPVKPLAAKIPRPGQQNADSDASPSSKPAESTKQARKKTTAIKKAAARPKQALKRTVKGRSLKRTVKRLTNQVKEAAGRTPGRPSGKAALMGAASAKWAAKHTARLVSKAAKATVKMAGKGAKRGIQALASMGPIGWAIIAAILIAFMIFMVFTFLTAQTYIAGFYDQTGDIEDVMDADGQAMHFTQERIVSTGSVMETSRRTYHRPEDGWRRTSDAAAHTYSLTSGTSADVGGEVEIEYGDGRVVDLDDVLNEAIADANLQDVVEWMLPQWLRPYPLLIAGEVDGLAESDGEVTCAWPDPEEHLWAGMPDEVLPYGSQVAVEDIDDVGIVQEFVPGQQNICHILAAADVVWEAWGEVFGEAAYSAGEINMTAATPILYGNIPAGWRNRLNTDGSGRLLEWLTFAYAVKHDSFPTAGVYDCVARDEADLSKIKWERFGLLAIERGSLAHVPPRLRVPEEYHDAALAEDGDILVIWECPDLMIAGTQLNDIYGFWYPWTFGPHEFRTFSDHYHFSEPTETYQLLAVESDFDRLWNVPGSVEIVADTTEDNYKIDAWRDTIFPDIREQIDGPGGSSEHLEYYRDAFFTESDWWLNAYTGWCGHTARWSLYAVPEDHPQEEALRLLLITETKEIEEVHIPILEGKVADARNYRIVPPSPPAFTGTPDEIEAAYSAWQAQVEEEMRRAEAELAALISGLENLLLVAEEEHEFAVLRELIKPWWPFDCEDERVEDMIAGAVAATLQNSEPPDTGSILAVLFTTHGQGRGFITLRDLSGNDSPLLAVLRTAAHEELLDDDWRRATWPLDCYEHNKAASQAWLDEDCGFERTTTALGAQTIDLPAEWTAPRLGLRCPVVDWDDSQTLYRHLAFAAQEWTHENMVSSPQGRFYAYHPCLHDPASDLEWMAIRTGINLRGFSFRTFEMSDQMSANSNPDDPNSPPVAPGGQSRHNYGLAIDFTWQPPADWPPQRIKDAQETFLSTLASNEGTSSEVPEGGDAGQTVCGMEAANGVGGGYHVFVPAVVLHNLDYEAPRAADPLMEWHWCWRFLDTMTSLSDNSFVPLYWLESEVWHWSVDGR